MSEKITLDTLLPDGVVALGEYLGVAVIENGKATVSARILEYPAQLALLGIVAEETEEEEGKTYGTEDDGPDAG